VAPSPKRERRLLTAPGFLTRWATLLGGFHEYDQRWGYPTGESTTFEPGCRGIQFLIMHTHPMDHRLHHLRPSVSDRISDTLDVLTTPSFSKEEIHQMHHVAFSPEGPLLATAVQMVRYVVDIALQIRACHDSEPSHPCLDLVFSLMATSWCML